MTALLENTFFSDKVRGAITLFLLVIIIGVLGVQYFFPRQQTLDSGTLNSLIAATEVMQKAAVNLENASQSQVDLNDTLKQQLNSMALTRNEGYEQLLKKYGLDLTLPGTVNLKLNKLDGGVLPQDNHIGGEFVPAVPGATGTNRQLPKSTPGNKVKVDPSDPLSAKQEPSFTGVAANGAYSLLGYERLYCSNWGTTRTMLSSHPG